MTTIATATTVVQPPFDSEAFDEAQLAAVSFLARYSGRTLEAYRHDLRAFFQLGRRQRSRGARSDSTAHRALPQLDGKPGTRCVDD